MSNSGEFFIQLEGGDDWSVEFPEDNITMSLDLEPVGPTLYRIVTVPLMIESPRFGDVIEVEQKGDRELRFLRVVEQGDWRIFDFLISEEMAGSERVKRVCEKVILLGGHYERVFGGILLLCLPPASDYDPTADLMT